MQNLELDLSNSNSPILSTILRMRERMDGWMDDSKGWMRDWMRDETIGINTTLSILSKKGKSISRK